MMKTRWMATALDVWDGVCAEPGRTWLSFLAIVVGITALTILLAVLGGLQQRSQQIVKELGVNVFGVVPESRDADSLPDRRLRKEHASFLAENLGGCVVAGTRTYDVPIHGAQKRVTVVATDSSLIKVRQWPMKSGRFLDTEDMRVSARNAVVSQDLSERWNWNVGDIITLMNAPYVVVGVVDVEGGTLDAENVDRGVVLGQEVVFVPGSTPPYWLTYGKQESTLDAIFVRVPGTLPLRRIVVLAERLLSHPDMYVEGLSWITPESLLRRIRRLQSTIRLTVGSIAVLCLILGGTTLTSLMVANVRDRITEIGLRRALGATGKDIAGLFVFEACLVTGSAALIGTLVIHSVLWVGRSSMPVPVVLGWNTLLAPILVAVILGVVFSYWPARAAARIVPSEALRSE